MGRTYKQAFAQQALAQEFARNGFDIFSAQGSQALDRAIEISGHQKVPVLFPMIIRPSITAIASRKFYRLPWTSPEFKRATAEAFQFVAGASFRLPASQGSMGTLRRYGHDTLQVDRERRPRFSAARLPWPFPILENHRVARLGGKPSKRWRSRRRGTTAGDGGP
jgi:hypothetical protein